MVSPGPQQRAHLPKEEAERLAEEDAQREAVREDGGVIEDTDELLDEIDALLEEQAVLTNFRQKGGQ